MRLHQIIAGILLIVAAGVVIHAPLTVLFGTWLPEAALIIKSWKEILILAAAVLTIVMVQQHHAWKRFTTDRLFQLIFAFAIVHFLSLFIWQGLAPAFAGLAIDLRFVVYFALIYILLSLYPQYRAAFIKVFGVGAVVVIGFTILQLFLPPDSLKILGYSKQTIAPYTTIDQNPDFVRYQSTLRGPNPLGAYIVIVLAVVITWLVDKHHRFSILKLAIVGLLGLIALYVTYSRGAYLGLLVATAVVLGVRYSHRVRMKHWIILGAIAIAIVGLLSALQSNDFVSNVVLHEDPEEMGQINSNDGHIDSLVAGTGRFITEPFGAGVGSTGSASLLGSSPRGVENQYLFVAHESGWLGLGLFVALFIIVLQRLWQKRADSLCLAVLASGIGLAVVGVFLPVWTDDTVSLVWWGLAGVVLTPPNGRTSSR